MNRLINLLLAPLGLCRVVGFQNVYRSGFYHRCGKPGMYDRHPGDLYATREAALADIEPIAFYVTTVKVVWYEPRQPHVNCAESVPVPITESRRVLKKYGGEYHNGIWVPPAPEPQPLTAEELQRVMASDMFLGGMW